MTLEHDTPAEPAPPWHPFRRLLLAQMAHAGGDALVSVALAGTLFFSVPIGEARDRVGLYLLLTMAPFAVVSPVVGPLLDRFRGSYRLAVVVSAAGRCVLALYMATRTDRLLLYPLAFGVLILSRSHGVARSALVPEILPPGRTLISSNARLSIASVAGGAILLLPGAGLQRWLGPGATLRFAAIVFLLGAAVASGLPRPEAHVRTREFERRAHRTLLTPRLLAGGIATAASRVGIGFVFFALAFVLRREGEGARGFAFSAVAAGAGGFAGALLAPALRFVLRDLPLLIAGLVVMGGTALAVSGGFDLRSAAIALAVAMLAGSLCRLGFDSLVQRDAPEEVRGRTFARYEAIFQLSWVGGAALGTGIPVSGSTALRLLGAICAGGIVLALRGLLQRAPEAAPLNDGAPEGTAPDG